MLLTGCHNEFSNLPTVSSENYSSIYSSSSSVKSSSSSIKSTSSLAESSSSLIKSSSSSVKSSSSLIKSSSSSELSASSSKIANVDPNLCEHEIVVDRGIIPTTTYGGLSQGAHCSICGTVINEQIRMGLTHVYNPQKIEKQEDGSVKITYKCSCKSKAQTTTIAVQKIPTEEEVYNTLVSFKTKYPEGMEFDDSKVYITTAFLMDVSMEGRGCAAFSCELSDAAFGDLPGRVSFNFNKIRPGDVIRMNGDTHSVIVLKVQGDDVTIAEANYNHSVHWERTLSLSKAVEEWNYIITRYPK